MSETLFIELIKHSESLPNNSMYIVSYVDFVCTLIRSNPKFIKIRVDNNDLEYYLNKIARKALAMPFINYLGDNNLRGKYTDERAYDEFELAELYIDDSTYFTDFLNEWIEKKENPFSPEFYAEFSMEDYELREVFLMVRNNK